MADSLKSLQNMVMVGDLEILHILAPPRTMSTAVEIACAEWGHGQIHEPFHKRSRTSFDDGCRLIHDRARDLSHQVVDGPVRLVVKDLSKYLTVCEWQALLPHTGRALFVIREPSRQLYSLATRYAHVLAGQETGLLEDDVLARLPDMPQEDLTGRYWKNLEDLFQSTVDAFGQAALGPTSAVAVLSGTSLKADPLGTMRALLEALDLGLPAERLVSGWTTATGSRFHLPERVINVQERDTDYIHGAWLGPAINSVGIAALDARSDSSCDITMYSAATQRHFIEEILPVYVRMFCAPQSLARLRAREVCRAADFVDSELALVNSVEAFLSCSCAALVPHDASAPGDLSSTMTRLRDRLFEEPSSSFADALVQLVESELSGDVWCAR